MIKEVLQIAVSESGGARILRLTGDLDSYTSERLTNVARSWIRGAKKIVVNLDGLQYIDSSGLSSLVGIWVESKGHGALMTISCQNPRIYRVLEITGLLKLFCIDQSDPVPAVPQKTIYRQAQVSPTAASLSNATKPAPVKTNSLGGMRRQ